MLLLGASCLLTAGCNVDEVTFGVGNARTEDRFGNPVMQPYDEGASLRLYRFEIERGEDKKDDGDRQTGTEEPPAQAEPPATEPG